MQGITSATSVGEHGVAVAETRSRHDIETFAFGTRFVTPVGPVDVEFLKVGDVVLTGDGKSRTVLWIREDRQTPEPTPGQGALHTRTRFPGVRFVRGRRADSVFQIIFGQEPATQPAPTQPEPEYVAQFSSSRGRRDEDDTPLAAE